MSSGPRPRKPYTGLAIRRLDPGPVPLTMAQLTCTPLISCIIQVLHHMVVRWPSTTELVLAEHWTAFPTSLKNIFITITLFPVPRADLHYITSRGCKHPAMATSAEAYAPCFLSFALFFFSRL
nr:hypothetical protein CFP56_00410 [Quercus suber]